MQVTSPRDSLLSAVKLVSMAVAQRTTKPILGQIKALADNDRLILMATDNEVGIRFELRGIKVSRPGAAIFPPARLASILQETSDPEVTINVGAESTLIRTSSGRYELPVTNPDEFPEIPGIDETREYHEITAGVLRTMLKRTSFAVEKRESTRFAVTGVLWEAEGQKARLVATDTRRLAFCEGPATVHGEYDPKGQSHLIPFRTIQLLERNLTDDGELIKVVLKPNEALFQTERAIIHTRLVEGRFPPYRNIIPKSSAVKLEIPVPEFHARIRQTAIMADEETRRVDFAFEAGSVTMKARGQEIGSGEVKMELPNYTGQNVEIAFDPNYLTEMLRAIDGEPSATLEMTDGQRPAVFRVGDNYLYLVMPLAG
jgi:DNA polymerase III subunit beta